MLLKIKAANMEAKLSWRFIENVTGLHYSLYEDGRRFKDDYRQTPCPVDVQELYFEDHNQVCCASGPNILFATFTTPELGAVHLFCDTQCYLLNENGRTIERLL